MSPPPTEAERAARARQRAVLWNSTFRSLYGPLEGEYVGALVEDDGAGQDFPEDLSRAGIVGRPALLTRLLAPLTLLPDFRTRIEDADLRELAIASRRDATPAAATYEEALEQLQRHAREVMQRKPGDPVDREMQALLRLRADEKLLVIEPAIVAQKQGVATVSRRARFRVPFGKLAWLLDPENWLSMGPFFERVGAVDPETTRRKDGWDGLFEEYFVVDWGGFQLQTFHTFLKVDYTVDSARVRTDYSLVYEADDQLDRDTGYLEVRRIPGRLGWCEYYGEKSMRLRSPQLNVYAPMMTAVFLQSGLTAMEQAAIRHNVGGGERKEAGGR